MKRSNRDRRGARMGLLRAGVAGIALWCGSGSAVAQPGEAQQEAFRLANELMKSISEGFADGDMRTGYARAIGMLREFTRTHRRTGAWDVLSQIVATEGEGLGMHEMALEAMGNAGRQSAPRPGLKVENAVDAIVKASEGRRVVMLNEAHHVGQHREFARRLLKPLRDAGFTHLACEAFANSGDAGYVVDAQELGYATRQTGHYIADPVFAELVREAVALGFTLVPYETLGVRPSGPESPAASVNRREADQASQLAKVLRDNPDARVFVYCGYSHLTESPIDMGGEETLWLAARLRTLTGIDPLTVSQTRYYPQSAAMNAVASVAEYEASDAFVLRGLDGDDDGADGLWSPSPEEYDIELLHPGVAPVGGRPGWLFKASDRHRVDIDLTGAGLEAGAVVVVTRAGEAMDAIPSDVVAVELSRREATVALRPGEYRVWLVRDGGEPELIASPVVE